MSKLLPLSITLLLIFLANMSAKALNMDDSASQSALPTASSFLN